MSDAGGASSTTDAMPTATPGEETQPGASELSNIPEAVTTTKPHSTVDPKTRNEQITPADYDKKHAIVLNSEENMNTQDIYKTIKEKYGLEPSAILALAPVQSRKCWTVQLSPSAYTVVSNDVGHTLALNSKCNAKIGSALSPEAVPLTASVIRYHYLPLDVDLGKVKEHFTNSKIPTAAITRITRETHREDELRHVASGVIRVKVNHSQAVTNNIHDLFGYAKIGPDRALVSIVGMPPRCMKCRQAGHVQRDCDAKPCKKCKAFTHETEKCTLAAKIQGKEHQKDLDENTELSAEILDEEKQSKDLTDQQKVIIQERKAAHEKRLAEEKERLEHGTSTVSTNMASKQPNYEAFRSMFTSLGSAASIQSGEQRMADADKKRKDRSPLAGANKHNKNNTSDTSDSFESSIDDEEYNMTYPEQLAYRQFVNSQPKTTTTNRFDTLHDQQTYDQRTHGDQQSYDMQFGHNNNDDLLIDYSAEFEPQQQLNTPVSLPLQQQHKQPQSQMLIYDASSGVPPPLSSMYQHTQAMFSAPTATPIGPPYPWSSTIANITSQTQAQAAPTQPTQSAQTPQSNLDESNLNPNTQPTQNNTAE